MVRLRRLLALVAVTLVAWSVLTPPRVAADPDTGFQSLRSPLFGLAIEWNEQDDLYRLIRIGEDRARTTLLTGKLEACQEQFLEDLTKRFGRSRLNLPVATLGGKQLWADQFIHCGWRIQKNVLTGHSRLLDPDDVRRGWGSYEQCRVEYERRRVRNRILPRTDHLVLLIHGLLRSKDSFRRMASALEKRGFDVEAVSYPSTRQTIGEHAQQLRAMLDRLEGYDKVSFVTHSLGGLVVRDLLAREGAWKKKIKVRRLVMLGPPNRGSVVAEMLQDWLPYQVLAGKVAAQLTPEEVSKIPPPPCSFGIIAGGTGTPRGFNPALGGDNDGTVLVENARLDSEDDFLRVKCLHSFLMNNEEAIRATGRFLEKGEFRR